MQTVHRREARFRAFVANAGDGFFLVASDGRARAARIMIFDGTQPTLS